MRIDAPNRQARRSLWQGYEQQYVNNQIGDDLDQNDRDHNAIWVELRSVRALLIGILISTTTASVMLAINLVKDKI